VGRTFAATANSKQEKLSGENRWPVKPLKSTLLVVGSEMYELDQLSTHSVHFTKRARSIRIILSPNPL
jgi:hypothetical protein